MSEDPVKPENLSMPAQSYASHQDALSMSDRQVDRTPDVGESLSVLLERAARYRRHAQTFTCDPIGEHLINCANALEGLVRETLKRGWAENARAQAARGAACDQ